MTPQHHTGRPATTPPSTASEASTASEPAKAISLVSVIAVVAVLLTSSNLRSPVSSFPPIADVVSRALGADTLFVGIVGMAPTAMFAVAAVLSGPLARALSFRAVTTTAMVLATVGFGLRAIASNEIVFLIGTMVGLVGVGITNTLLPALVKDYFPFRLTTMSIAYMVAGQISMATASVVAVPLEQWGGWRLAIGIWAVPPLLAALCWALLVFAVAPGSAAERGRHVLRRSHPRQLVRAFRGGRVVASTEKEPHSDQNPDQAEAWAGYRHIWRHPVSWGIVAMFAMTSSISYCFITWAPKIVVQAGGSPTFGGVVGGVFAAMGIVTAFLCPWAVERFRAGAYVVTILSAACMYTALTMLLVNPAFLPVVWISLVALGCATFQLGLILIATRTRQAGAAAALSSGAQGIGYTVASVGPFVFGALFDATGSWTLGLVMLLVFNSVLFGAGLIAGRPVFVDDPR